MDQQLQPLITVPTRLPGLDDAERATITRLADKLQRKTVRNLIRTSYYDGKRALQQVGSVIPPQYYELALVLGWSAKAVDTLADRCNLDRFVWPDGNLDDIGAEEVLAGNEISSEVAQAVASALLHGVVFAISARGARADEPAGLLHFKDATSGTGEWNARTRRLDNFLSITGFDDDGRVNGFALYLDRMTIVAESDGRRWWVDRKPHGWSVPVEPLAYKPRAGRPLGQSRISRPVMSLHDQALRTVIRLEGHMDVYSFPELWLLGADETIFKNSDGSMKAPWQVMLGRIKGIPDDPDATPGNERADVKQFRASDPDPHLKALKQQAQLFSGETSIPLADIGVADLANPASAESYIASREGLIALAEKTTEDWIGPRLARAVRRTLAMANGHSEIPESWRTIAPKWRSPIHLSRAAEADAALKTVQAFPWLADTEVGLELSPLTDQQIRRAMSERRRAEGRGVLDIIRQAAESVTSADSD